MAERNPRDLAWVKHLEGSFVECRSLRHVWELSSFKAVPANERKVRVDPGTDLIKREVTCLRCTTTRTDYFQRRKGAVLGGFLRIVSRYKYPQGYRFVGQEHEKDRPEVGDFHQELMRRFARATGTKA